MKEKATGKVVCVYCSSFPLKASVAGRGDRIASTEEEEVVGGERDSDNDDDNDADALIKQLEQDEEMEKDIQSYTTKTSPSMNASRTDDLSDKIGKLLLAGWAMLNDHCEKDGTPLMRDTQNQPNKRFCVACDAFLAGAEEGQSSSSPPQIPSSVAVTTSSTSTSSALGSPQSSLSVAESALLIQISALSKSLNTAGIQPSVVKDVADAISSCLEALSSLKRYRNM